jgi:hydrogenase nickel incorporation protein HypB
MCETCGCDNNEGFTVHDPHNGGEHEHGHDHAHSHDHGHDHAHSHDHSHPGEHKHQKTIDLGLDIMERNNITASMNRRFFEGRKVLCLNMVSSPGSGKTTILEKTIRHISPSGKVCVIEGDQQTTLDASRIEKAGAPAVQINTGSGCHLDAHMIDHALEKLNIEAGSVLFIENVGNLVCPAMFDLGESKRVLVMSVTEGEDKPLKYPLMFETSHLCILNKSDLLPYVDFRTQEFIKNAQHINPHLDFITMSATTEDGIVKWYDWIASQSGLLK